MNDKTLAEDALAILAIARNHLEQYRDYSKHMRQIGRGFTPSSRFSPEYLDGMISGVMRKLAEVK